MIARVRDRATFEALEGARWHRQGPVWLRCLAGDGAGAPRVAYAVRKRAGNAVVRNRIRRRLRAAVAHQQRELAPGAVYLFGGSAEVATMTFDELTATIGVLLARAGRAA